MLVARQAVHAHFVRPLLQARCLSSVASTAASRLSIKAVHVLISCVYLQVRRSEDSITHTPEQCILEHLWFASNLCINYICVTTVFGCLHNFCTGLSKNWHICSCSTRCVLQWVFTDVAVKYILHVSELMDAHCSCILLSKPFSAIPPFYRELHPSAPYKMAERQKRVWVRIYKTTLQPLHKHNIWS